MPPFPEPSDLPATYFRRSLPTEWLTHIHSCGLFKLFVPTRYGGLELELAEGLRAIHEAGRVHGSLGWCINLGAGAGYFAGFFDDEAARILFADPGSVIAGSARATGKACREPALYRLTGRWGQCSGAAHASAFTVNATEEHGSVRSFAIPRERVTIRDTWVGFALRATSTWEIHADEIPVPEHFAFTIGTIRNPHAYAIHALGFEPFARFCMAAAYVGIVECFARHLQTIDERAGRALGGHARQEFEALIRTADDTWRQLEHGERIDAVAGLAARASSTARKLFDRSLSAFYRYGLRLADERQPAHYALRDVMLASQHFYLKP